MTTGRVNPQFRLEDQQITGLGDVHYNLMEPALIEAALKKHPAAHPIPRATSAEKGYGIPEIRAEIGQLVEG